MLVICIYVCIHAQLVECFVIRAFFESHRVCVYSHYWVFLDGNTIDFVRHAERERAAV